MIGNLVRDQFLKARDWPFGATFALVLTLILIVLISIQSYVSKRVAVNA
jgi:spermidine/putrescine transport system permease protein